VKLGKKRRESSERNYYIISPRLTIKAIVILQNNKSKINQKSPPRYATIPVLLCACSVSILLKTWWWCVSTFPDSDTVNLPTAGMLLPLYFSYIIVLYYSGVSTSTAFQGADLSSVYFWSRSLSRFVYKFDSDWLCEPGKWMSWGLVG